MAELVVSKKNIASLLSLSDKGVSITNKKFIIPEYQRPYSWDTELCDVLWTDIINFYTSLKEDEDAAPEYFLGTIVTCSDRDNSDDIDIIDGQQRITSLLLLLRAFYKQLEDMKKESPNDPNVLGLITTINPCIWQIEPKNRISKVVNDYTKLKIESRAALDKDNSDFKTILSTGKVLDTNSNYSKNYKYFLNKCMDYAAHNPMDWKELCQTILDNCIVLPIECNDLSSALTIFGTLNNRGLPLSDSDIFKAELYKAKSTPKEKADFAEDWKSLEETAEDGEFTINDVFRYYTHVLRARKGITEKEIGLRRFYAGQNQKFEVFKNSDFFKDIMDLANFWKLMNQNAGKYSDDNGYCTKEATKYMQCLIAYPNDYWRCLVTVYFFKNRGKENFKDNFESFLRRLLAYLDVLFIMKPMVNEVKVPVFRFCVEVENHGDAIFKYDIPNDLKQRIENASQNISKIIKPLILLDAYLYNPEQEPIVDKIEIEHILPKKWKEANYNGWDQKEAIGMLESIGNKIPFGKRLNIQAGNGYFGEKKKKYIKSTIIEVQDLCKHDSNDWLKDDIIKRRDEVCNRLIGFFNANLNPKVTPDSEEQILFVRKRKEKITLTKLIVNGVVSYRLDQIKQESADKLSMTQVLSGNIPLNQSSNEFSNLKNAIQAIDKSIIVGAESFDASDKIKQTLLNE